MEIKLALSDELLKALREYWASGRKLKRRQSSIGHIEHERRLNAFIRKHSAVCAGAALAVKTRRRFQARS